MVSLALLAAAGICLAASLLPLLPLAHGAIRMFDFGRLQLIALALIVLAGLAVAHFAGAPGPYDLAAAAMAAVALGLQLYHVLPFTPLGRRQTRRAPDDAAATLSLLTCNVKQGNRDYARVAELVRARKPDIAIFMETDAAWAEALGPCLGDFEHVLAHPLENSYGMILASRLPLEEPQIRFLLNDEVPSIACVARLPGGARVRIYALHPEPPVPTRDTQGRDAEILLIAEEARDDPLPVIVTGDLNDVAWSDTTRRFLRLSRLLDPRQGRGFFNSFHAHHWYVRWPLDHVFHSDDFGLVCIERMPDVGSDHFPMFYRLALTDDAEGAHSTPPPPTEEDFSTAADAIGTEQNRSRRPAGTDWE